MASALENLHLLLARVQHNRESAPPSSVSSRVQEQHDLHGQMAREQDFTPLVPVETHLRSQLDKPISELWPAFAEKDADSIFVAPATKGLESRETFASLLERSLSLRTR